MERRARAQAPAVAGGDRERIHPGRQLAPIGAAEKQPLQNVEIGMKGGEGRGTLQKMSKHFDCTIGKGSDARRDLGPANERIETAPLGQSYSAQLQESVREGGVKTFV